MIHNSSFQPSFRFLTALPLSARLKELYEIERRPTEWMKKLIAQFPEEKFEFSKLKSGELVVATNVTRGWPPTLVPVFLPLSLEDPLIREKLLAQMYRDNSQLHLFKIKGNDSDIECVRNSYAGTTSHQYHVHQNIPQISALIASSRKTKYENTYLIEEFLLSLKKLSPRP